ncbi:hypothetical protein Tco_0393844 [Tanacetum coccineum]
MKEWYVVKGTWLEGLINLGVDLCHQQVVSSLERDEVEVKFGCHLEVRVEIEHEAHQKHVDEFGQGFLMRRHWRRQDECDDNGEDEG